MTNVGSFFLFAEKFLKTLDRSLRIFNVVSQTEYFKRKSSPSGCTLITSLHIMNASKTVFAVVFFKLQENLTLIRITWRNFLGFKFQEKSKNTYLIVNLNL